MRIARSKRLVLFVLFLAVIGALALRSVLSGVRALPYQDSFAKGKSEEWQAFGGTWELVDGAMRNESDERGAKLLTGSTRWKDYSVEADVKLLGHDGDAGLIARSTDEEEGVDSYNGYYAGLRNRDNALVIGRADHGWLGEQSAPLAGGIRPFRWYHLKLTAVGCDIAASATDNDVGTSAHITLTERNCTRTGRIGLRSYSSGGVWRNVRAALATHSELRDLQSEGKSVQESQQIGTASNLSSHSPSEDNVGIDGQQVVSHQVPSIPQPINGLRLVSRSNPGTVTVRGVVVLTSPALYVQDPSGGVAILQPQAPPLKVGDEVEVTGRPEPRDFSSALRDATVRLLWAGAPIPPVSITASQAATGAFDASFIEVEGYLTKKESAPGNSVILYLQHGEQSFRALMGPGRGDLVFRKLKLNSLLRLRGISVVDSEYTQNLTPFVVLLRSTEDVDVLAGPPWWSTGHLVIITVIALTLILVTQIFYSRAERWRLHAVLEERERLAHEMHDTIAQSFAGIGFQLQAIRNDLQDKSPAVHRQLDLACDLVRHSHEEARRSIRTLRPESLDSIGLLPALDLCARRMVNGGSVRVVAESAGDSRPIPTRISDTLFRIGQEAIANAVRHAFPTTLNISLRYDKNSVCMVVEDNGVGFSSGGDLLGFGLRGMRKRADSIAAAFHIVTALQAGTRVEVTAPLPPQFTFKSWFKYIRHFLQERRFYAQTSLRADPNSHRR